MTPRPPDTCLDHPHMYNREHCHGALGLMTPHDIHYGLAAAKWQQRAQVLRAAYHAHPERFSRGVPVPRRCRRPRGSTSPRLRRRLWLCQTEPAHDGDSHISEADCLIRLDIFRIAFRSCRMVS